MKRKAFTMVELLVVVVIVGVLAAVAIPRYNISVERSRTTEAMTILSRMADARDEFFVRNRTQPNTFNDMGTITQGTISANGLTLTTTNYIYTKTGTTFTARPVSNRFNYSLEINNAGVLCRMGADSRRVVGTRVMDCP